MSVRISAAVWDLQLDPTSKFILLKIADCAHDDGTSAWPAVATIATDCCLSERTVQRSIHALIGAGILSIRQSATPRSSTVYDVHPECGVKITPTPRTRQKPGLSPDKRLRILQRDGFRCSEPGCEDTDLTIDHKDPVAGDGDDNLQTLCRKHNSKKGPHVGRPQHFAKLSPLSDDRQGRHTVTPAPIFTTTSPDRGSPDPSDPSLDPSPSPRACARDGDDGEKPVEDAARAVDAVQRLIGRRPGGSMRGEIGWLLQQRVPAEWFEEVCTSSEAEGARAPWPYTRAVLDHWRLHGKGCACRRPGADGADETAREFAEVAQRAGLA